MKLLELLTTFLTDQLPLLMDQGLDLARDSGQLLVDQYAVQQAIPCAACGLGALAVWRASRLCWLRHVELRDSEPTVDKWGDRVQYEGTWGVAARVCGVAGFIPFGAAVDYLANALTPELSLLQSM